MRRAFPMFLTVVASAALVAAGCGTKSDSDTSSDSGSSKASSSNSGSIALLLPETKTTRYETQDKPNFEKKLKDLCSSCKLIYSNADQDASKQLQQAEAALTQGAKVLVVDPVDADAAATIVARAKAQDVPVVSYDRLIGGGKLAYYVSYDNAKVGELQGQTLVDKLKADGKTSGDLVMINGSPTDPNAALFKSGAHKVIDASGFKVAKEYDTPDWSPDKAQDEMTQAITALGKDGYIGIYAANDGTAGGAIAAIKGQQGDPSSTPITGQDAELAGIQRVVSGEQYMTIYKAIKPEAEIAAEVAVKLLHGDSIDSLAPDDGKNGDGSVPTKLFTPVAVTADKVKDTVVADGFWTTDQICTADYADACSKLGLS